MAVFPPIFEELMPWDNMQDFVNDFTKGIQEIADLLDPTQDNSGLPVVLGTKFSTPIFWRVCVNNITDAYSDWAHSFGGQPYLLAGQLNVSGSSANVSQFTVVGKLKDGAWNNLNDSDKAYVDGLINSFPFGSKYSIVNINNAPIVSNVSSGADPSYVEVPLLPYGYEPSSLYYHNLDHNDTAFNTNLGVLVHDLTTYEETEDQGQLGYISIVGGNSNTIPNIANKPLTPHQLPFIGTTEDQNFIDKYVTGNGAEHNYHVTTSDGYDVYYGDNYYIIKVNGEPVTYNKIYNTINTTLPQIEPEIHVPTYNENKYGPEPPPPTDDDDIDDQTIGAGANLASIARLWLLTRQQLIDLHAAFTSAPANYDPLTSFIGVLGFGVQPIKVVGDSIPWTLNPINIRMTSGEVWHTGVEGHIVDSQVSAFSFPNIKIKKRYNNFLDYSPYATHEIFIPMCGWLTLPDIAVDRTISVTYLPDLESMRCRAVVSVVDEDGDKCVIGVKDGIMGAEVPFSNLNHSVWLANLITNAADVAGEVVTGAIGAGFTKTNAKGGTYRPYEGFTIGMAGTLPGAVGNALLSGNVNRTHVVGSNGNRTGFSDGDCVMIKSTYHKIDKPDNYDHTIGKVCNKTGQLSEFHGFTVCDNPHIHISALDEEKEEIKRLLEEGVILPDGE